MIWKIQKLLQKLAIITNVNQFTEPQYHLNWSQAKILKISNSRFSSLYSQKNMSIIRYNYDPLYPNTGTGIFRIGHPISQVALIVSWTILGLIQSSFCVIGGRYIYAKSTKIR